MSISERHAKLLANKGQVTITDLGSKNGIFISDLENRLEKGREIVLSEQMTFYLSEIKCRIQKLVEKDILEETLVISKPQI